MMNSPKAGHRRLAHLPALAMGAVLLSGLIQPVQARQGHPVERPQRAQSCLDGKGSIAGVVKDEDGRAVTGADVQSYDQDGALSQTTTDIAGAYRLEQVCDGDYVVMAFKESTDTLHVAAGFYDPGADGEPDPVTVNAQSPSSSGIDITLAPLDVQPGQVPIPPTCQDPRGTVAGRVLDSTGQGVAGMTVQVFNEAGGVEAVTAADGAYKAEKLCTGSYLAFAWDGNLTAPRMGFYNTDTNLEPDAVVLNADDAAVTGIDITVLPAAVGSPEPDPGPQSCEAPQASITGTILDAGDQPVPGAQVVLFADEGYLAQVQAGPDGSYQAQGLCLGSYRAMAFQQIDATHVRGGFRDADGDGRPDVIVLDADHMSISAIDIRLTLEDTAIPSAPAAGRRGAADFPAIRRLLARGYLRASAGWPSGAKPAPGGPPPIRIQPIGPAAR